MFKLYVDSVQNINRFCFLNGFYIFLLPQIDNFFPVNLQLSRSGDTFELNKPGVSVCWSRSGVSQAELWICPREPSAERFMSLTRCCGGSRRLTGKARAFTCAPWISPIARCCDAFAASKQWWISCGCVFVFVSWDGGKKIDDKCGAVFKMSHVRWSISERVRSCSSSAGFCQTASFVHSLVGLTVVYSAAAVSRWPVCHAGL